MPKNKKLTIPFSQILDSLLEVKLSFPAMYLHRFSDLSGNDLAQFKNVWAKVTIDRRLSILVDLEEAAEADTMVSFDEVAKIALIDSDARVRASALKLLWESEDNRLIPTFISMLEKDDDAAVRASAAAALSLFVFKGELEEIPAVMLKKVEESLLKVLKSDQPPLVCRRALESLGYSGREEVPALLKEAYQSPDGEWQASALFAMGRSADIRWEKMVIDRLDALETEVKLEAIRAAGQLELESARHILIEMLDNYQELEEEIRMATAWSLSQIGGNNVREVLEKLIENVEDEDEADYFDLALENLQFTQDVPGYGMYDMLNAANIEEHTQVVDLSLPDGDGDEEDDLSEDKLMDLD
ncbi:MAG: HEAT repeat domain-containing protein [Saprospiraceae bacterium]|nr:HEAT repeat domain-containing protein [Saprospiraceae bacterium]